MKFNKNILSFIIIGALGTISHFIYEWSGENYFVGLFFPVNESTWEHLKLLFYPTIIYSLFEYFSLKEKPENYIQASIFSLVYGMFSIVAMFYIYIGVIGKNIDFINITIYFIAIIITIYKKNKYLKKESFYLNFFKIIALVIFIIFVILFSAWSYYPPELAIFKLSLYA